jgi:GNAT superfamily N-acetyltransferase
VTPPRLTPRLVPGELAECWPDLPVAETWQKMLTASDVVFALVDRSPDRLVGFARILTDDTYLAIVLDVVVAAGYRERGLGRMLLDAIVTHPRLADIQSLELVCQPDLIPFYQRWGFTDAVGMSRLMRRSAHAAPSS